MVDGATTTERVSHVEVKRPWNTKVKDNHNWFPKVVPELFSFVTFLERDGGTGTIKEIGSFYNMLHDILIKKHMQVAYI